MLSALSFSFLLPLPKITTMKTYPTLLLALCISLLSFSQIVKTTLHVTVRDELGNTVEGATIQLFETEEDYNTEKNIVAEGVTDKKGILRLKELKAMPYFVLARTEDKDNAGGGERVEKLEPNKINKVTIIIQ
jgi:hypothetical protein